MAERFPIYLVTFPSQYLAAATFMRIQEHYESASPRFRGKAFGTEEFMDAYAKERGEFSYFEDWSGFNVPSRALRPFFDGKFDPLSRKERTLLGFFRKLKEPYYVIGSSDADATVIAHEFVHGLFTVVPAYREDVLATLRELDGGGLRALRRSLKKIGYCDEVLDDESNAYLTTSLYPEEMKGLRRRLRGEQRALADLFERHFGFDIRKDKQCRRVMRRLHRIRFPRT